MRMVVAGSKYGMLTVQADAVGRFTKARCSCDCGAEKYVAVRKLLLGETKSCGVCLRHRPPMASVEAGQRFGKWVAMESVLGIRDARVLCRCDCGQEKMVLAYSLRGSKSGSCGCATVAASRSRKKHGNTVRRVSSPAYRSWLAMRKRCEDAEDKQFSRYGGRGITVCERWRDFANFLADMGPRPPGTTIDRRDNNGSYSPDNCRWATPKQQARNRRDNKICPLSAVLARHMARRKSRVLDIAHALGLSEASVRDIVGGKTWVAAVHDLEVATCCV